MAKILEKNQWVSFLKSISNLNGDFSSIQTPPNILSPISMTEFSQYWGQNLNLLLDLPEADAADESSIEQKKFFSVLKWFISCLYSHYSTDNKDLDIKKKPLNPVLGEIFVGKWKNETILNDHGESILLTEQVSHHPPITSFAIINKKNNVVIQGYNKFKTTFLGNSILIKQLGYTLVLFKNTGESFLVTLPDLHIDGFLVGNFSLDLIGKSYVHSSSGYTARLEYQKKKIIGNKRNSFRAEVFYTNPDTSFIKKIASIHGKWSGVSQISTQSNSARSTSSASYSFFLDPSVLTPLYLHVKNIENQHQLESRRVWSKVSSAIKKKSVSLIQLEKNKIEFNQRKLWSKNDLSSNWKSRWFDPSNDDNNSYSSLLDSLLIFKKNFSQKKKKKISVSDSSSHWIFSYSKWIDDQDIVI